MEEKVLEKVYYMISDAAKEVEVESHVLRYWEEELELKIKRNELGHRYYTREDVQRFIMIRNLKEKGLQLKAIKLVMLNGNIKSLSAEGEHADKEAGEKEAEEKDVSDKAIIDRFAPGEAAQSKIDTGKDAERRKDFGSERGLEREIGSNFTNALDEKLDREDRRLSVVRGRDLSGNENASREEKAGRLQFLLRNMISEAVRENNEELCENIKSSVLKEMDYQFRLQEEREEERDKRRTDADEARFRKLDEMMRERMERNKRKWKGKKEEKGI